MHSPWSQQGQLQRQNNKTSITLYRSGGTQSWTTILYIEEPWPASADSSNNYPWTSMSSFTSNKVGYLMCAKAQTPIKEGTVPSHA